MRAHGNKRETISAIPATACSGRVHGWFRDPAVWAWGGVALLSLLPLASALARLLR